MQISNKSNTKEIEEEVHTEIKDTIGFILFFIIFIIAVPIVLFKYKLFTIIEVYLPNIDLIANLLTWIGGPSDIWKQLYISTDSPSWKSGGVSFINFSTEVLINYIALLGLTFIVARESVRKKNIFEGWSFAFIMVIITYLLPVPLVNMIMATTNEWFKKMNLSKNKSKLLSGFIGFIITLMFLFIEALIIKNYRKNVVNISKYIYKTPKNLNFK
jgi:hypothetical protein